MGKPVSDISGSVVFYQRLNLSLLFILLTIISIICLLIFVRFCGVFETATVRRSEVVLVVLDSLTGT